MLERKQIIKGSRRKLCENAEGHLQALFRGLIFFN